MTSLLLRNVRPWGAAPADIAVVEGRIDAVGRPDAIVAEPGTRVVDGAGRLALPGLINAHAHVDKSWWGLPWVSYGGEQTTQGRIAHERAERDRYGIPNLASTAAVLREFLRHGTTATRSHVDVDLGVGLRGIETVREAAAALGGAVAVSIVAFPQDGVIRRPGVLALLDRAAAAGVESIGGLDPAGIDRDPVAQLDGLFAIAGRHGVGLDLHLHDGGELGAFTVELIIERTLALGLTGRVNISHGFALGEVTASRQRELIERLAGAGVSWTTVAPVGIAALPWREMLEGGVPIGLGTDGIRDLWSPYGDGDLLRVALGFARLHGVRRDHDFEAVARLATSSAAGFVGRDAHDLVPGAPADIVLLDAENVPDALVRCPPREVVIARGRIVVEDGAVLV